MKRHKWADNYHQINESFASKLVFRLGADAGFYSEYNNLILAVIYSLLNKISFRLQCEGDKNFYKNGWNDYFEPFFKQVNYYGLRKYNVRPYMVKGKTFKYLPRLLKKTYNINYLTQDIFDDLRTNNFNDLRINEPRLGLSGGLLDVTKVIIENLYKFNHELESYIVKQIRELNLPKDYISVHIRSGDKANEVNIVDTKAYYDFIIENFPSRSVFVYTDNYDTITEFREINKELTLYSLAESNESGYFHSDFINYKPQVRKDLISKMFVNIEILSNGTHFLGTFDSNIAMFINMRKGGKNCLDVYHRPWRVL